MYHYTHLTPFEREKTLFFLADGKSVTEIAHLLKRSKSTISRELRRNAAPASQPITYCPLTAQALYKQHREACRPHKRLAYVSLHAYIQICILEYHWSPEEIVGRIHLEHGCRLVSVPMIYRAIHAGLLNPPGASAKFVLRKLRHHRKRHHKKGREERRDKFVIIAPIEDRPTSATNRSVRGHWEADTVVGKQGKACPVMPVDRKSRYLLGGKATSKTAAAVNLHTIHESAGATRIPMGFCRNSSRKARTSRIHQRITSNGSIMNRTCSPGSALATNTI